MKYVFDRFLIKGVAGVGFCVAAMAFSPQAVAGPMLTGGYDCVEGMAGAAPGCAVAVEAAGVVPLTGALPGPPPVAPPPVVPPVAPPPVVPPVAPPPVVPPVAPPPVVPPLAPPPVVPPVPAAAPLVPAAGGAAGAPLVPMSGVTGKGAPTNPQVSVGPEAGIPTLPGDPGSDG